MRRRLGYLALALAISGLVGSVIGVHVGAARAKRGKAEIEYWPAGYYRPATGGKR